MNTTHYSLKKENPGKKNSPFILLILLLFCVNSCSKNDNKVKEMQTDVYVVGGEYNGTIHVAKVWKNGIGADLSDGTQNAHANSVYVSGGDVYVAGSETNTNGISVAKVWKKGIVAG